MGAYVYDPTPSLVTPGYFTFAAWMYYSDSTSTATTYTVYLTAGAQLGSNTGTVQKTMTCTMSDSSGAHTTRTATKKFSTGDMDSSKRSAFLSTQAWTWTKEHTSSTKTITVTLSGSGMDNSVVTHTITVPALASYTVTYALNGGTGSFNSQTKYYGETLTLRTGSPSKPGYTFAGWKSTGGYTYQPGGSYTANSSTTLTAQWTAITRTISYKPNGGSGSIANQTKTYGKTLTLSSGAGFTRTNYKLSKWNTNSSGTGTSYNLGATLASTYTGNDLVLYAIWTLDYVKPTISNVKAFRTDSSGNPDDFGTYIKVTFEFTNGTQGGSDAGTLNYSIQISPDTTAKTGQLNSSPFTAVYGTYSTDISHTVSIKLWNSQDTSGKTYTTTVGAYKYPIDLLASGNNVYMGIMTPAVSGTPLTTNALKVAGALTATGNASVSSLTIGGHGTNVGYRNNGNGTKSLSSNNSSEQISGNDLTLTAGTWILIGAVDFPYTTNTASITGVRHIMWYQGSTAINGSRVTVPAYSNIQGFSTRLQTITTVSLDQATNFYIYGFQDSGSTMTVNYYWQIVRIA